MGRARFLWYLGLNLLIFVTGASMHNSKSMAIMLCIASSYMFAGKPLKDTDPDKNAEFFMRKNVIELTKWSRSVGKKKKLVFYVIKKHPQREKERKYDGKTVFFKEKI